MNSSKKTNPNRPEDDDLRRRAEERLAEKKRVPDAPSAAQDSARLLHELEVHQVELEMQNEELRRANEEVESGLERYTELYDFAPVGYFTLDGEGIIRQVNLTGATLLGVERSRLVNRPFGPFVAKDVRPVFSTFLTSVFESKAKASCEVPLLREDRTPLQVRMDATVSASGVACRAVVMDITARKTAEAEQRRMQAQLQHVQKLESLGVMASGIAHDFNNLLVPIVGGVDLARQALSPASPAHRHLLRIENASLRAADLCKQMLAYAGRGRFVVETINVNEIVGEMTQMLELSVSKNVVLTYNINPGLPAIDADATQLSQVLVNLVTNASEAVDGPRGIISITTGSMACDRACLEKTIPNERLAEGRYVYIEVSDTGSGMTPEVQAKMFDPFFTTKFMGRGLGMAAVLGIVRGHKGAIRIQSEPGRGTTIRILFPASDKVALRASRVVVPVDEWKGSGTILVVDDEEVVRTVSREMLEQMGFRTLLANDGHQALDAYREHHATIVCVLLDLTMPNMDGEETYRELRLVEPNIQVVMASGYNLQELTERFIGRGLAGFIQKPFKYEELRAKLREVLGCGSQYHRSAMDGGAGAP